MSTDLPLLLFGETESNADLFHAIPLVIIDPFPYVEDGERRVAVLPAMETPRVAHLGLAGEVAHGGAHRVAALEQGDDAPAAEEARATGDQNGLAVRLRSLHRWGV